MATIRSFSAAGLLCAAFMAVRGQPQSVPSAPPAHTYWQFDDAKIIVDLWRCPQTKLCFRDHWVDPADANAQAVVKFMLKKDWKHHKFFQSVTDREMHLICGYETPLHDVQEIPPSAAGDGFRFRAISEYHALTDLPGAHGTLNEIDIHEHDHKLTITTNVHLSPPLHGTRLDVRHLHQVDDPPPACQAPAAAP